MISSSNLTEIKEKQAQLEKHPLFCSIKNIENLRHFMSCHVFAVWDFMCLVKRLQRDLTSVDSLWLPSEVPQATRLINDIVLAEESDEAPDGSYISHFELYLLAMKEVGADTKQIEDFIQLIRSNMSVSDAMEKVSVSPYVQRFVNDTINTVTNGSVYQVLGSFFFGREHVIPSMFKGLLDGWHMDENDAPMFVYYLKRHIELDADEHGPAAIKMIKSLTHDNNNAIQELGVAAEAAIEHRIQLWNGVRQDMS